MVEFYTWTQMNRSYVSLLLAFCVMAQTLTVVFSFYRRPRERVRLFENLLELVLLFHIVVLSLLMGQEQQSHIIGLIVPTGYIELRYISSILVVSLACGVIAYSENPRILLVIAISSITMPITETLFGNAYAWIYITALVFWLLRSVCFSIMRYREIRMDISAMSIKDTIDSLHSGILFSDPDGHIALINIQMQRLMTVLTGKIHRDYRLFYDQLVSSELLPDCRKMEYEGQIVCLLPDKAAWMFTNVEIQAKNKRYIQFTATNVTQQYALTMELQRREELLLHQDNELRKMTVDLNTLSKTRELQNAKLRAHDILGHHLSILLHSINSEQAQDYSIFCTKLQNLLNDLKSGEKATSPREKLDNLQRTFDAIGVKMQMDGVLPEDDIIGYVFVDIINESIVNAVRHGFATEVFVRSGLFDSIWHLEITDNGQGHLSPQPIREGGGISGMRSKVEPLGGLLTVSNKPRFVLKVELPGGVLNV